MAIKPSAASQPHGARPPLTPQPQDETTGVVAFFGAWIGDETDEEVLDAVQ